MPRKPAGTPLVKHTTRPVIFRLDRDLYRKVHKRLLDEEELLKPKKAHKMRGLISRLLEAWMEGRVKI